MFPWKQRDDKTKLASARACANKNYSYFKDFALTSKTPEIPRTSTNIPTIPEKTKNHGGKWRASSDVIHDVMDDVINNVMLCDVTWLSVTSFPVDVTSGDVNPGSSSAPQLLPKNHNWTVPILFLFQFVRIWVLLLSSHKSRTSYFLSSATDER